MDTFKKRFIDSNGDYKIEYWHDDSFQKYIDEDKPLYMEWLNSGNTPEEIEFIPTVPPAPTVDELRNTVKSRIIDKQNTAYDDGFLFEGNVYPSSKQYREMMAVGARAGQKAIDTSGTISLSAFTISGTVEILDQNQLVDIQEAYDTYGLNVYNTFINEMTNLNTATSDQLLNYIQNGKF